jgi:O-antigen/teichoic acid export membrane protein
MIAALDPDRTVERRRFAGDAAKIAATQYAGTVLAFATTAVATRLLGPAEYGLAALAVSYPVLLWSVMSAKPITMAMRYISEFRVAGRPAAIGNICVISYVVDLAASAATLIVAVVTASWISTRLYSGPGIASLMIVYALSLPFSSLLGTSLAVLSAYEKYAFIAGCELLEKIVTLGVLLLLAHTGHGAAGMVWAMASANVVGGISMTGLAAYTLHQHGVRTWWRTSLASVSAFRRDVMSFLGWNYVATTCTGILAQGPILLLGHFRGPEEAGFYRLANSLVTVGSYLASALGRVSYRLLSEDRGRPATIVSRQRIRQWLRHGLVVGIIVGAGGILILPRVVLVVFGPEYERMIPGMQFLVAGTAVASIFFWLQPYYYAAGHVAAWAKGYGAYTVAVILLGAVGGSAWGFGGLAALLAIGLATFTLLMAAGVIAGDFEKDPRDGRRGNAG